MFAELNVDADCIAAGLASLLLERGGVGLDDARAHLGDRAATLLEGLLRFDELRSIQAEDAAPADRDASGRSAAPVCFSPSSTTCVS